MPAKITGRGLFGAAALLLASALASAQNVTTGTLAGRVTDQSGAVLPGALVTATHEPTGTTYEGVTEADGRFQLPNVRVGGPYRVLVTLDGFRNSEQTGLHVKLGESAEVQFSLELAAVAETVTVVGETSVIDQSRAGTASNVSEETIESLPTIARSLGDFARVDPHFNQTAVNSGPSVLSVAGRNVRYNNVQIDGAVNNDVFGLADSGTPGGQTDTQPVSLDAIQEIQLVVSPYDVRQGGFSGGGLNAVTRSGSNDFHGTAYYFGRNDALVGDGPDDRPIGTFSDKQGGVSVGGPIATNRAFFFFNADYGRRQTPSGFSIDGSGQQFGRPAEAERFRSILRDEYGYDPGDLAEFTRQTDNDKYFIRGDFNPSTNHQLTLRHNYIDALNDIGTPSSFNYIYPDRFYRITDKTNSTVVQLNSTFGKIVNEFRFTYQRIRDNRGGPTRFPSVQVAVSGGGTLTAGRENFSTANSLDQDVVEITNDLTWLKGRHTFTFGTHNEFFTFDNLFIRDNFGTYYFTSLDLLEEGFAQQYDHSFSATSDPQQSARFSVNQIGFYAGDQWRLSPSFTLTYGLRVDAPLFPDKPTRNPVAEEEFGYATDVVPESVGWSPRAGFNWAVPGGARRQLRGGIGLFFGRTPYVWMSNQYGNSGIEFTRLSISRNSSNRIPFVTDPDNQPTDVGNAATNEIDVVDPDYSFPQTIRGNLAFDQELAWGLVGTVELLFSNTVKDIDYQNLNLVQIGTQPDGRPLFARNRVPSLTDVILLTNTGQGSSWSISGRLEKPFTQGWYASAAYLYGEADSVTDGGSSQASSNWGNVYVPGDPNAAPLARSNYDVGHRITIAVTKDIQWGAGFSTTFSAYYNGQSGRVYSGTFNNTDANGDRRFFNDLLYVPASADEVVVTNGTWSELDAFIEGDDALRDYRGQIVPRNTGRSPWVNSLDFRFVAGVPIRTTKVEFTADVLNLLNLFGSDNGVIEYATYNQITPIRFGGIDEGTGRMIYDLSPLSSPKFVRDDLRSRWQAQFGVRFRF
jgi:Carboxypeptidase regulatory-like domain